MSEPSWGTWLVLGLFALLAGLLTDAGVLHIYEAIAIEPAGVGIHAIAAVCGLAGAFLVGFGVASAYVISHVGAR